MQPVNLSVLKGQGSPVDNVKAKELGCSGGMRRGYVREIRQEPSPGGVTYGAHPSLGL